MGEMEALQPIIQPTIGVLTNIGWARLFFYVLAMNKKLSKSVKIV